MILIKNGHVTDPKSGLDGKRDVLLDGEKVKEICRPGKWSGKWKEEDFDQVIDAEGMTVAPGLIDVHVHF